MVESTVKDERIIREITIGAKSLFEKYGLKKTTMEDIAREVGKGKSALYYYFTSKEEIFEAVLEQEMQDLFFSTKQAVQHASSAKAKLKIYAQTRLSLMNKMTNLCQVVKKDILDHLCAVYALKKKYYQAEIILIRDILSEGIKSEEFKKISKENVDLFATLLVTSFRGFEIPVLVDDMLPNIDKRVGILIDLLVEGIGKK